MSLIKATGCAFNLSLLFINFPLKKLKITCKLCKQIINDEHRDILVKRIFRDHYKLVINDVIDNNITFVLPIRSRRSEIHMQVFRENDFKLCRKHGRWKNVDFLKSWFTGNIIGFFMHSPKRPSRVKNIYVNKRLRDKIAKNTNDGKTYC